MPKRLKKINDPHQLSTLFPKKTVEDMDIIIESGKHTSRSAIIKWAANCLLRSKEYKRIILKGAKTRQQAFLRRNSKTGGSSNDR